eukprot:4791728-Alexandrium_andersonii.AAC.1
MAGFADVDAKFPARDAAFAAVTEMRSTRTLEWAYNRCSNERAKALAKADDLDWYLRNYSHWRSQKRDRDRDYRH